MLVRIQSFAFVVAFLFGGGPTFVADNSIDKQSAQQPVLTQCEGNNNYLSNAHHLAGNDGTIIVIARLGDGERNRELNRRRLHNVLSFLTDSAWHRDRGTVIIAEGEKVKGYGRAELYVRGVLFAVLAVRRNEDLMVGSCYGKDRNLYPYLDRKSGQRK